ncbi:immunoglobulin superfamily member 1-like [Lepus europaeus]|uniref:immunoglobulin superfamily member 1-like n=1 Tax=Lepus europaeus TaxID=9983 RepID=UPI002B471144|nr:immunoglobulin superfamily member 1-like [Lepus europaeus]
MTPALVVLLCLGCAGPRTRVQAGTLPRPSLWAEPGSVIALGRPVALWCQGTLEAQECRLYKEGIPEPWDRQIPLEPGNKAKFSIPLMAVEYAGRYRCVCLSAAGWSEPSDALELRVSGAHSKPSLSALPSAVVTAGGSVTLQCRSQLGFHRFILTEEGAPLAARTQSSEPLPGAQSQALFPVGPVTPGRRWAFRCYGSNRENPSVWSEPSDALELMVTGPDGVKGTRGLPSALAGSPVRAPTGAGAGGPEPSSPSHPQPGSPAAPAPQDHSLENLIRLGVAGLVLLGLGLLLAEACRALGLWPSQLLCSTGTMGSGAQTPALTALLCLGTLPKPSIWAVPGPLVAVGSPVTLWCQGSLQAEVYRVHKEGSTEPWERRAQQDSRHKASFAIIQSMSSHDTGQYWCVYQTPLGLSQPSDPLTLVVTGMFPAPSLSAQPSPVVASGGDVSLSCGSDEAGTAHLLKEGRASPQHSLEARFSQEAGEWQATFLLGPMSSTQGGIYRCYRAHPIEPQAWSVPSDPLELQVTGMYRKPSLQAQPGPSVPWGAMVALRCGSQEAMDTFLLHREGSGAPPQRLRVPGSAKAVQATFTLGPVTSAHGGTYRCYCAHSTDPYLWSQPSDPLQLEVSAPAPQDHSLENLIRLGVAGLVLLGLGLLLAEAWYSQRRTRAAEKCGLSEFPEEGVRGFQKSALDSPGLRKRGLGSPDASPRFPGFRKSTFELCRSPEEGPGVSRPAPEAPGFPESPSGSSDAPSTKYVCEAVSLGTGGQLRQEGLGTAERCTGWSVDKTQRTRTRIVLHEDSDKHARIPSAASERRMSLRSCTVLSLLAGQSPVTPWGWGDSEEATAEQELGGPEPSSPSHPQPGSPADPAPQDHTVENLIRLGVAGLVLLGLGLLLAEACRALGLCPSQLLCSTGTMGGGAQTPALTALLCLGLCRAPGDGAQAGTLPKPSIWADPGPLVTVGSPVTLWCQGSLQAEVYRVHKEDSPQPWEMRPQQDSRHKASFAIIQSMSSHDSGQYWCVYQTPLGLSQSSVPLILVVTGMFPAPSLSAQPSPVVASGGNVSLSCGSDEAGTAHLLKEGEASPLHSQEARISQGVGEWQATFLLGPMSSTHGGIYRCYRAHTTEHYVWSLPSDPLELQVTGVYRKPSLQAQPGPSVPWGAMVALRCGSQEAMDTFLLHREGSGAPPQRLRVPGQAMAAQATFMLGPVTSAHGGTYRCYCAHSTDPYLWSQPSDSLQLEVSAPAPQDHTVENLIRLGVAGLVLLGLGLLLAEAWYSQRRTRAAGRQ